jgi:hypothetical protein
MSEIVKKITGMSDSDFLCNESDIDTKKGMFFVPGVPARQSVRIYGRKIIGPCGLEEKRKAVSRLPMALSRKNIESSRS